MNEELNWEDILLDIEEQQAVLLLGHGFLPGAQQDLYELFISDPEIKDKLLHFHEKDGLFLFKDNDAKTSARKVTARYYRQWNPGHDLLKKIIELPFRLMVSANPDKSLVDAFEHYGQPVQFDKFPSQLDNEGRHPFLTRPEKPNPPLLYNLCGSYEDRNSLILDYDDLFGLLKNLLANNHVPNSEVRRPLQDATTFIFFGFQLERWYTQLFLRYLNQNDHQYSNNSRNYALKTTCGDPDTRSFLIKQFNIRYIGADMAFFEELYQRFADRYPRSLRVLQEAPAPPPPGRRVFLSYNHRDRPAADRVAAHLRQNNFSVTIDHEALLGGADIEAWIQECMRTHDFVVSLASGNSLRSGWVGLESKLAEFGEMLRLQPLRFVALGLAGDIFSQENRTAVFEHLEAQMEQLKNQLKADLDADRPTEDLQSQLNRTRDHRNNLGKILDRLQRCKTLMANDENFDRAMAELVLALETNAV